MNKKHEIQINEDKIEVQPLIPLKHETFRASVNGAFARVRCIQEYENNAAKPVEACYVFPLPDEASVNACVMKIGDRKVEAIIKEREGAQKEYDEAIEAGHHASLLKQERPNIFSMNVGGIEPGEKISVEVDYVQRIPWQAGGGRFSIPLVVAPRFIPGKPTGQQGGGWSPDTDEVPDASLVTPVVAKEGVPYDADISIMFSPGFKCQLSSPSHESIVFEQTIDRGQTIELKTGNIRTDRDFILVYQSLSEIPEAAVHGGKFQDEAFVLASIIPPGEAKTVDSDIVALLDISGSMSGAKLDGLKVIMKKVISTLVQQQSGHNLCLVAFESEPHLLQPFAPVSSVMGEVIDKMTDMGGTELGPALTFAHHQFTDSGRPRVILLITDGQTFSLSYTGKGVRIISIGIDSAVNDTTIKDLAQKTGGTYEFVYPGEDYSTVAGRIIGYLSGPVLREVKVETAGDVVGAADVFKGRPATIAVRFSDGKTSPMTISGLNPDQKLQIWKLDPAAALEKECDFAAQIFARELIRENQEKDVQISTSLKYGVLCNHTAFVAVSIKEVPGERPVKVEIPVNLPYTWDYDAVFDSDKISFFHGSVKRLFASSFSADICGANRTRGAVRTKRAKIMPEVEEILQTINSVESKRFDLTAPDIVDRLIGVLIALNQGKREDAEKTLAKIKQELPQEIGQMSEEKKAMAYYFALRLASYGLKLGSELLNQLEPNLNVVPAGDPARAWVNLMHKELGRSPIDTTVPSSYEASDYLAWKFGKAEKPVTGDWSLVP